MCNKYIKNYNFIIQSYIKNFSLFYIKVTTFNKKSYKKKVQNLFTKLARVNFIMSFFKYVSKHNSELNFNTNSKFEFL